jgi:hypothetical protein
MILHNGKQYRKLEAGEEIQVGDLVRETIDGWFDRVYTVIRVTKKYAFACINDRAEAKYSNVYNGYSLISFPREAYNRITCTPYREIT